MAKFDLSKPENIVYIIIFAYVSIQILVQLAPLLITGIVNISNISNMPFAEFFQANGVVLILFGVLVLLAFMKMFGFGTKKR